jgi:Flp pilus assembly protein TadD
VSREKEGELFLERCSQCRYCLGSHGLTLGFKYCHFWIYLSLRISDALRSLLVTMGILSLCLSGMVSIAAPTTANQYFQQGSQALTRKRPAQAVSDFRKAVQLNPQLGAAWRGLGVALGKQNQWSEAAKAQRKATELLSEYAPGWVLRGWAEHRSGNHRAGAMYLEKAVLLDKNNLEAHNALGVVYLFLEDPKRAEVSTRKVLDLDPKNGTAYFNLGLSLDRQGRYQEAVASQEQAHRFEPRNPHPLLAQAIGYEALEQKKEARKAYVKALGLDARYAQMSHIKRLVEADFNQVQIKRVQSLIK